MGSDEYNLDLCRSCGYCFVNPRPSFSFLMNYYSSLGHGHDDPSTVVHDFQSILSQERNDPNSTIDAKRLIMTIKSLVKSGSSKRFLDVGCGYGFFSKEALDVGFDVIALELAENERAIAKEMTKLTPVASAFEEFECIPESLGVVLMSQILEHAFDVNAWIKKSHDLLVRGGFWLSQYQTMAASFA